MKEILSDSTLSLLLLIKLEKKPLLVLLIKFNASGGVGE